MTQRSPITARTKGNVLQPLLLLALASALVPTAAVAAPRLAVIVVVDQLRAVDVDRLAPLFGPGGLGGLERRGAHVTLRYSYSATETGPGHATIATGANPPVHGIALNRWWEDGRWIYTVEDPRGAVLGAPQGSPGRGPALLLVPTLGDAMKVESGGVARVVTFAGKDRSAILMGGHAADLAVWYDAELGAYTSSEAYVSALPAWLSKLAEARVADSLAKGRWSPLPAADGLKVLLPPDEQRGQQAHLGGLIFPHDLAAMSDEAAKKRDYRGSPQSIDDVIALGLASIDAEGLGQDAVPDLLVIGVSATDYTGHWFGPGSLETVDLLRRLDASLRELVRALDAKLGRDGYVLALTGDHGAPPPPERVLAAGVPARRIPVDAFEKGIDDVLARALPKRTKKARVLGFNPPHLYLDLDDVSGAEREQALAAVRAHIEAVPGVLGTWRLDEEDRPADPWIAKLRQASHPDRSGTLLVLTHPHAHFDWGAMSGSNHGTPYAYDARVPLFVIGPGVRRGRYAEVADPRDVAPTVAFLLRGPPPDAAEGRPLSFLLKP